MGGRSSQGIRDDPPPRAAEFLLRELPQLSERVIEARARPLRRIRRFLRGRINKTAATVGVETASVQRARAEMGPFDGSAGAVKRLVVERNGLSCDACHHRDRQAGGSNLGRGSFAWASGSHLPQHSRIWRRNKRNKNNNGDKSACLLHLSPPCDPPSFIHQTYIPRVMGLVIVDPFAHAAFGAAPIFNRRGTIDKGRVNSQSNTIGSTANTIACRPSWTARPPSCCRHCDA